MQEINYLSSTTEPDLSLPTVASETGLRDSVVATLGVAGAASGTTKGSVVSAVNSKNLKVVDIVCCNCRANMRRI